MRNRDISHAASDIILSTQHDPVWIKLSTEANYNPSEDNLMAVSERFEYLISVGLRKYAPRYRDAIEQVINRRFMNCVC